MSVVLPGSLDWHQQCRTGAVVESSLRDAGDNADLDRPSTADKRDDQVVWARPPYRRRLPPSFTGAEVSARHAGAKRA
jgi:hypothetical protein